MSSPLCVSETAETFWSDAGQPEPFPRDLRVPIANALPLTVVLLPRLRVRAIDDWLRRQGIRGAPTVADRAVRACLVARSGQGFIFVEGSDPADEQRFSLAHELGHFLRDYWQPRQAVIARLGPAALEVLDGARPARPGERIDALLARVRLGYYVHLMDRGANGGFATASVEAAERDADWLACELLAPPEAVLAATLPTPADERRAAVRRRLIESFGLPPAPAAGYAARLAPEPRPVSPLLHRLGRD
ncbi:MAG: ImmA/IrrE family metallo-endopeptidase [Chloroflexota bacterium]